MKKGSDIGQSPLDFFDLVLVSENVRPVHGYVHVLQPLPSLPLVFQRQGLQLL